MSDYLASRLVIAAAVGAVALPCVGTAAEPVAEHMLTRCVAAQAEKLDFSGALSIDTPWARISYVRGVQGTPDARPITPNSRFNLASAGKMFTAVAVAQLVEAGKVGLDDPVGRYVQGLTPAAAAVTVRQLLTHSSGLGNFFIPENLPALGRARSVSDLMPLVASEKPSFTPGSKFQYSNSGFLILGRLVEQVSGESYETYLRRFIFEPVGMAATGLSPSPSSTLAVGLTSMSGAPPSPTGAPQMRLQSSGQPTAGGLTPGPLHPSDEAAFRGNPAGGSYSTPQDIQRFFAALQAGRLVSAPMLQQLTSRQIVAAPAQAPRPELDYGFGFGVGLSDGHRWFGHNGGAPGVTVEANFYPDDHVSMVVVANRDPPSASLLFRELRRAIFDKDLLRSCAAGA